VALVVAAKELALVLALTNKEQQVAVGGLNIKDCNFDIDCGLADDLEELAFAVGLHVQGDDARGAVAAGRTISDLQPSGGIGFLLNGNMLVGVWKESLIVRLGPEDGDEALLEPHVREFDITGRAMKGWVLVDPEGIDDGKKLRRWIQRAIAFVAKFPAK
jgi:TfoX N-terminal domain